MPRIDLDAALSGSVLLVRPATALGREWLGTNAPDALWLGGALACEHRFGPDLLMGAHLDGLTVALDGRIADAPRTSEA